MTNNKIKIMSSIFEFVWFQTGWKKVIYTRLCLKISEVKFFYWTLHVSEKIHFENLSNTRVLIKCQKSSFFENEIKRLMRKNFILSFQHVLTNNLLHWLFTFFSPELAKFLTLPFFWKRSFKWRKKCYLSLHVESSLCQLSHDFQYTRVYR